jgi:transposase
MGYTYTSEALWQNALPKDKQIQVIAALAEGSSIRAIERMTGVHRDTIIHRPRPLKPLYELPSCRNEEMPKRPKKAGRPKLPKGSAKAGFLRVRVTGDELKAIEARAKANRQTISEFVRGKLLATQEA